MKKNFNLFTKSQRNEIYKLAKTRLLLSEYMCIAIDDIVQIKYPEIYEKEDMIHLDVVEMFFPEMHSIKPPDIIDFKGAWFGKLTSDNKELRQQKFDEVIKMTEENGKNY
jgi:hypothetical protein